MLERLQKLHRVVKVFCDFKGQNVAVLCHDPILRLLQNHEGIDLELIRINVIGL